MGHGPGQVLSIGDGTHLSMIGFTVGRTTAIHIVTHRHLRVTIQNVRIIYVTKTRLPLHHLVLIQRGIAGRQPLNRNPTI